VNAPFAVAVIVLLSNTTTGGSPLMLNEIFPAVRVTGEHSLFSAGHVYLRPGAPRLFWSQKMGFSQYLSLLSS
jgi:hypothetical protein